MIDSGRYDNLLTRWLEDIFGRLSGVLLLLILVAICGLAYYLLDYRRFKDKKDDPE